MPERVVTLKIKVDDRDVDKSTASVQRLNVATQKVGQVSIPRSTTSNVQAAEKAISATSDAAAQLGSNAGIMASRLGGAAASAGPLTIALAAVAAVGVGLIVITAKVAREMFDAAKAFSEYALAINKGSEETGLMTRTVAGLTVEAERQGRSFEGLKGPVNEFRKAIGQAAAGSEDARKRLNLLGIDGTKAINSVDAAFRSAVATIVRTTDPIEQARLSFAAFGDDSYKILPFLREFNGDVAAAVRRAEELGLAIGEKDVAAAKEFNKAYADLQKVVKGISYEFGKEFLPVVVGAFRDFNGWIKVNRNEIVNWASIVGNAVLGVIGILKSLANTVALLPSVQIAGALAQYVGSGPTPQQQQQLPPQFTTDYTRPNSPGGGVADNAALEAMRAAQEKMRAEREKAAKDELAAQIRLFEKHIAGTEKIYDEQFKKITESFKETGNVDQYEATFSALRQWYGDLIGNLAGQWSELVQKQTMAEKTGQNARYLAYKETQDKLNALGQKTLDFEDQKNKAIADAQKKASAEMLQRLEKEMQQRSDLSDASTNTRIAEIERDYSLTIVSERQKIDAVNKLELDALQKRRSELVKYQREVVGNSEKEADVKQRIALLDQDIAQQQITNANRVIEAEKRKREALEELRKQYDDYRQSLEDEILILTRGGRPLSRYEETLRDIRRNYQDLAPAEKERLLTLAAQADALEELNRQHAELKDFFSETLSYAFEGDFEGLLDSITRRFRESFIDNLSNFLATEILGFDPNATENPVAKPIVGKIDKTNQILNAILGRLGGSPVLGGGGGGLSGILGGLGNFGGSGNGPGGTPYFNPNAGGIGGGGGGLLGALFGGGRSGTGSVSILPNGEPAFNVNGSGGGFFGRLTGPGGIFGREGFGNNVGTYGAIGAAGNLLGGLIGGRGGSAISGAATGLSIGASIGSIIPGVGTAIGAVVGAAAGFLAGLFGFSDPKRKRDKNEKIPALNDGFAKAIKELNEILAGVRQLRIDPDEAVSRATQVRAEIAGGFGIQFESKKYRKQAQTMISSNLSQADGIIAQIKAASDIARGAADRSKRILPEFAGGHYFADYFRPNGLVPGAFDGADNILAMISRGEMVLNPVQQARVRALAGGDVFAGAGIPNYPRASSSPRLATGGIAGAGLSPAAASITNVINPTIVIEGVAMDDRISAYLESDDGVRTQIRVAKRMKKGGELIS